MEPVRLQPPTCLPLLLLERTRVNTVFLHGGDTVSYYVSLRTPCDACHQMFFVMLYVYARLRKKKKKKYGASTLAAPYLPPSAITGENESEYSLFT